MTIRKSAPASNLPGYADLVRHAVQQGIHFIVMNAPDTRNALSPGMVAALDTAISVAQTDSGTRAIVLRGAGGIFSAGGNIGSFVQRLADSTNTGPDPVAEKNRAFGAFLERIATLDIPLIAVVEGAAIGGGFGLAASADFVLATANAKFSLTETTLGILPAQIAPFLIDRLGVLRVRQLSLSAQRFDARTAHTFNLVDMLGDDEAALLEQLAELLARITRCAPNANRRFKALLRQTTALPRTTWLDQAAKVFSACMRDEGPAGIAAFREKRTPVWATFSLDATSLRAIFTPLIDISAPNLT